MPTAQTLHSPLFAAGLSTAPDTATAIRQACEQAGASLAGAAASGPRTADLVLLFFSTHHRAGIEEIETVARRTLQPGCLIALSAESVIGGAAEIERSPGISVLAASLPGVTVTPFTTDGLIPTDDSPDGIETIAEVCGLDAAARASFFFADPFSVPMVKFLPAFNRARKLRTDVAKGRESPVLLGGMVSGGRSPGDNVLLLNDSMTHSGAVGVTLSGPIVVDCVVSQGCRPFGPTVVITKAKGNVILELAGRPTPDVLREAIESLGDSAQERLGDGLFVGRVVNEYKERFGRNDFLIRNVVGLDGSTGGIAVADLVKIGQTVRFHVRDRATASEDLAMLMDVQRLYDRPDGALIISCNGRGQRLFGRPHNDAATVARAFASPTDGAAKAKPGSEISAETPLSTVPTAGFFASGEIGPIGDDSFIHAHTACVGLFRHVATPMPRVEA